MKVFSYAMAAVASFMLAATLFSSANVLMGL